jgi:hypothetical protein
MTICHYRLVRNHLGSDRKECLQRNLPRDILYKKKKKKKKKERKKERRVTKSLLWLKTSVAAPASLSSMASIQILRSKPQTILEIRFACDEVESEIF